MRIGITGSQKRSKLYFHWAILTFLWLLQGQSSKQSRTFKNYMLNNSKPCETDDISMCVCWDLISDVLRYFLICVDNQWVFICFNSALSHTWIMFNQNIFKSCSPMSTSFSNHMDFMFTLWNSKAVKHITDNIYIYIYIYWTMVNLVSMIEYAKIGVDIWHLMSYIVGLFWYEFIVV